MKQDYKHPRVFLNAALEKNAVISLDKNQTHYFRTVLRRKEGDNLRVFNGKDGEYLAVIKALDKKSIEIELKEQIREQPKKVQRLSLYFSPIKTPRLSTMIEKAVELGVSDLYPVLTQHTEKRYLNIDRTKSQIIEAAEQCERLDIPVFHESQKFNEFVKTLDRLVLVALERKNAPPLKDISAGKGDLSFLIGPEGGFTDEEIHTMEKNNYMVPMSLGENILRSETASVACLAWARLSF
ncbi:MAG: 16S rRNA (uracil(1498)-N(3))-methyltransferase [Alphaproteobacteria bacterium]|nr:16S rRNA (uracil(1498)-N(3))-methyltransferase [Alphaproteobacteria bacterium]